MTLVPLPPAHERIYSLLPEVARPILLEHFTADSCIGSTRIALDVLSYFGVPAKQVSLRVMVWNPETISMLEQGAQLPEIVEAMRSASPEDEGGPWTIGIGGEGTGWSGHLVVGDARTGALLDLAADQFDRPHKSIVIGPYFTVVDDEAWWKKEVDSTTVMVNGSAVILSHAVLDREGYRQSPNWRRSSETKDIDFRGITGQVISALKERL